MDNSSIGRFWQKVNKKTENGCWEWLAGQTRNGYGLLKVSGISTRAHRFSWELHHGEIPKDKSYFKTMFVLHKCDNRLCVNPDHLFLGTAQDNISDMVAKGRAAIGETHGRAKLSEIQVRVIRRYYPAIAQTKLAEIFKSSTSRVSGIILRQSWKHI